jgi:hypothetical protein
MVEATVLNHNQAAKNVPEKEVKMVTAAQAKVRLLNGLQWVSW